MIIFGLNTDKKLALIILWVFSIAGLTIIWLTPQSSIGFLNYLGIAKTSAMKWGASILILVSSTIGSILIHRVKEDK